MGPPSRAKRSIGRGAEVRHADAPPNAEVARRLQRDPSTLFVAVERYRTLRPELFNLTALQDSGPLLRQLPSQASQQG